MLTSEIVLTFLVLVLAETSSDSESMTIVFDWRAEDYLLNEIMVVKGLK